MTELHRMSPIDVNRFTILAIWFQARFVAIRRWRELHALGATIYIHVGAGPNCRPELCKPCG